MPGEQLLRCIKMIQSVQVIFGNMRDAMTASLAITLAALIRPELSSAALHMALDRF